MERDHTLLIIVIVGILATLAFAISMVSYAIRANEGDNRTKQARYAACANIEDEALKALCLAKAP